MTQNPELEKLENLAKKLGFTVTYSSTLSWNFSKVSFYPIRNIIIGIKNYSPNSNIGYGQIPDSVKALFLNHEIGHILSKETIYSHLDIEQYCFPEDSHTKIIEEIQAWKNAIFELTDSEIDTILLELIQEAINEYVFCEECGTYTIDPQVKLQQTIINKIVKVNKKAKVYKEP